MDCVLISVRLIGFWSDFCRISVSFRLVIGQISLEFRTHYVFCYEDKPSNSKLITFSYSTVYNGIGTSFTLNKLKELTSYCCRIRSRNEAGEGEYSKPVVVVTKAQPPSAVKGEYLPPLWCSWNTLFVEIFARTNFRAGRRFARNCAKISTEILKFCYRCAKIFQL